MFCEDGNSVNEEGFDHPPSSSSEESDSDDVEEEADASEGTLSNIISKLNSAGINVSGVIWKVESIVSLLKFLREDKCDSEIGLVQA